MKTTLFAAVAATFVLGVAASAPASAAVTLVAGEEDCDLFTTGCLFTHGGGGEFDDAALIVAAYNAAHDATPAPEDLPELIFLGKSDEGFPPDVDGDTTFTFTDLPWDVSFYTIKAGPDEFLLFGLDPAADSFTATNLRITNKSGAPLGISHVTFFGTEDGGGGGGGIPEPATWAMMIMGFGGVGSLMRRRRRAVPA